MRKKYILNSMSFAMSAGLALPAQSTPIDVESQISVSRISTVLRIPKTDQLDFLDNNIDPSLEAMLKSYGVSVDQKSEIKFHEEDSFIDLSCFSCLIRIHAYESTNAMPDNKGGGDRRF